MIEIYGKPQCPFCVNAKKLCEVKGLEHTYYEYIQDFSREELLEMFPNAKTFPQIKVDGVAIGGYKELHEQVG